MPHSYACNCGAKDNSGVGRIIECAAKRTRKAHINITSVHVLTITAIFSTLCARSSYSAPLTWSWKEAWASRPIAHELLASLQAFAEGGGGGGGGGGERG